MPKKTWALLLSVCVMLLTGCQADRGCLDPISPDALSQDVYDGLRQEWGAWNSLSREAQMLSSHLPGCCRRDFDNWAECEAFLGLSIPNPLEECDRLEQATYVAMPLGFRDAPRIEASWYGTEDGHVEWISVCGGYRDGDIRVMLQATLYGDPADTKSADSGWSVELERQDYLGNPDDDPLQVHADSTDHYFSNTAYQAYGNILYRFHVVGGPDAQSQVERTLEQVVNIFSDSFAQEL